MNTIAASRSKLGWIKDIFWYEIPDGDKMVESKHTTWHLGPIKVCSTKIPEHYLDEARTLHVLPATLWKIKFEWNSP